MTDPERIAEIRAREERATAGPWTSERDDADEGTIYYAIHSQEKYGFITNVYENKANANFIAHARSDIPFLLSALESSQARVRELDKAADIIADFFATTVIAKLEKGYRDLYVWERDGLEWLYRYRENGGDGPISYWTASYMELGPPPWPPGPLPDIRARSLTKEKSDSHDQ